MRGGEGGAVKGEGEGEGVGEGEGEGEYNSNLSAQFQCQLHESTPGFPPKTVSLIPIT